MKLGEMLVNGGILTPAQLDEGLKCQVIFGGRLGTNLVEMGLIREVDLAMFLSKKLEVPFASPEQLMSVPPEVQRLIPAEIAEKYKAIPVRVDNRRLTIAMADPTDFAAIDEIAFISGYIIVPLVSPEIRIILALEKFYGFKRTMRYIPVSGGIRTTMREGQPAKASGDGPVVSVSAEEIDESALPLLDVYDEPEPVSAVVESSSAKPKITLPPVAVRDPADDFAWQLVAAEGRDEIINALINYLGQAFTRAIFFIIKGNVASGVKAVVHGKNVPDICDCAILLNEPSVLNVVVEGKSFYLGSVPDTPANHRMLGNVGGGLPSGALLFPLMMMGRVVSVVYLDGGKTDLGEKMAEVQKIIGKASLAFEILILKNKILST